MNKAFIFDMDGVIVNSEPIWDGYGQIFLPEIMGKETYLKAKDQILGNSVSGIYAVASRYGLQISKQEFERIYDKYAEIVYREAKINEGIQELINKLISMEFKLGLVSSSRQYWIDMVIAKFSSKNPFQFILSLDGKNVRPKPFPDGYLRAIEALNSQPRLTIIVEDSQRGIKAAKASGAITICLQEFLPKDYLPKGADRYVKTVKELINQIDTI